MRAYERLLNYVTFDTASDENSPTIPSTERQKNLGQALVAELIEMGVSNARMDEYGYVYARVPGNVPDAPVIGLIAHMDTVSDVPSSPVKTRIVPNFQGGDLVMDEAGQNVFHTDDYPEMKAFYGDDILITDGNTLLGADDKAGVAEIMTACERLLSDASLPHGDVAICFTPDEEIGRGPDKFDVAGFGAAFAYTVDGGLLGEVEYENFNAATANIVIHGVNIHPGSAKNKMKNAALIACEFAALLPPCQTPAHTEGYEGFYHLNHLAGCEEKAEMRYILRDHDRAKLEAKKAHMARAARFLNDQYGEGTVDVQIADTYRNMREALSDRMDIVERALRAMETVGAQARTVPIRGGTDGARLSFMGLPCPNLPTGGQNFHSRQECASIRQMDKCVEVLLAIIKA